MEPPRPNPWERWTPPILFLLAFSFVLIGVNPTFYVDDSAETVTACVTLGIPHPPGYPLYTLAGRLFSLIPLGHYPFRVNLFSALLAASASLLLFLFLKGPVRVAPRLAALFALFWNAGATIYPAALSAKGGIYQLTTLFLLGILWALFEERLELAAFLLGLSFAHHWMTMLTFLPGFALLLYGQWKGRGWERRLVLRCLALGLLGLSAYLFLPIRAQLMWQNFSRPDTTSYFLLNWGNPSTWNNFVFDFLRSQYTDPVGGGLESRPEQIWVYLKTAFFEFGGLLLVALWGMARLYPRFKSRVVALGVLWVCLAAAICLYLGLPKDRYYLIADYALVAHAFILLFAAWGLQTALFEREPLSRSKIQKLAVGFLLLLLLGLGALRLHRDRQTDYTYSYDFVLNGFKTLPLNTLYFCKGDSIIFPAWYFQWVEGRRTDLAVVGIDGLPMEWVRRNLAAFHPGLKVPRTHQPVGLEAIPFMAQWMVDQNKGRELYFSYNKIEDRSLPGTRLVPYGLTEKGFLPVETPVFDEALADRAWRILRLRHLQDPAFPVDARTRDLTVHDYAVFRNNLGILYEDRGDDEKGHMGIRSAAQDFFKFQHDYQMSLEHFQWAQQWSPEDPQFAYNLGNACYHVGKTPEAMAWYEKATQLNPNYVSAFSNWAVVALQTAQYDKAKELFQRVLQLKPGDDQAQRGLDYLKKMGK